MSLFKVRVSEIIEDTPDIKSFRLVRLDGEPFDPYQPGAHIDVVGPSALTRQYSLVSNYEDPETYRIAVKLEHESRGGSAALHQVQVGSELEISQPRNLFTVAADADKHLLVAAGIGVTPLVSMAHYLKRRGESFEFHYFARSREEAAFVDLLERKEIFGEKVYFHFGVAPEDVPQALQRPLPGLTLRSHVYVCGPQGFMTAVERLTTPLVGDDNFHVELFEAAPPTATTPDTPFEVELDTGEVFEIPAGVSIVDVLRENGVDVETSCNEGICGTCVNAVLEGVPDHRDNCLSKSERAANDQMALCVSRAKTPRLVIELY
jgi:vanillate O-demethylase ferredoxin subunit